MTQQEVLEWVRERYDNCIRIAAQKTGPEKAGWLTDAAYFEAIARFMTDDKVQAQP